MTEPDEGRPAQPPAPQRGAGPASTGRPDTGGRPDVWSDPRTDARPEWDAGSDALSEEETPAYGRPAVPDDRRIEQAPPLPHLPATIGQWDRIQPPAPTYERAPLPQAPQPGYDPRSTGPSAPPPDTGWGEIIDDPIAEATRHEYAARSELLRTLDVVRGRLSAMRLPLDGARVDEFRHLREATVNQLDDYLLPRLRAEGAPLLVVVGGSTGAGKSTLVNSILGAPLTRPGVLRPTTRSPVLVHNTGDAPWFGPERVLPNLPRIHAKIVNPAFGTPEPPKPDAPEDVRSLRLVPFAGMPAGLALLDAPDIDSVERANRELAAQLLAAADLWLFVTTAARYADAVPWDLLTAAAKRHAQIALVLDRIDLGADAVVADLQRMMHENGLGDSPLFVVPESPLDAEGMLPERAVAEVSGWLTDLGGNSSARDELATATRDGMIADLVGRLDALSAAGDEQIAALDRLKAIVAVAYRDAHRQMAEATTDGAMLRGEVLGRWQDFVGAGDLMRSIEEGIGKVRDRIGSFLKGKPAGAVEVETAIAHGLEAVALDAVETARERVIAGWRADPAGSAVLVDNTLPFAATGGTAELRALITGQIRGWQQDVLALVREQGEDRRGLARAASFGVNGLGVSLMVLVFAGTGGLSGAEIGIAGGTAVIAQKLLEATFGDDAVRRLTKQAQERLEQRLDVLLDTDSRVAMTRLDAMAITPGDGEALRRAAADVVGAARAERAARPARAISRGPDPLALGQSLRGAQLRGVPIEAAEARTALPAGERIADEAAREQKPGFWKRLFGARPEPQPQDPAARPRPDAEGRG
ncbi:dynamin family protein [Millisia brevis]|uniref:dynamin family protein n=1 Tax=Millisia brevis TaxID=264148 RepID=UPI001C3F41F1|nr:dynamin family protein [Millisia brevis]